MEFARLKSHQILNYIISTVTVHFSSTSHSHLFDLLLSALRLAGIVSVPRNHALRFTEIFNNNACIVTV